MPENGIKEPQFKIHYGVTYVPERKTVVLSINQVVAVEIPFDILKQFYYEMDKQQKAAQSQLLVPDKRIVVPSKQ